MANWKLRTTHRAWEDWAGIFLGIFVALAPWILEETGNTAGVANAAIAGFLAMMLAELDLVSFRRPLEVGQLLCGLWIAASPRIFDYDATGSLALWHIIAGLLIAALGVLELSQQESAD